MVLAARALAGGGHRVSPLVVEWDVSGRCQAPLERDLEAMPYRGMSVREWDPRRFSSGRNAKWFGQVKFLPRWSTGFTVRMIVKCRKCERCRMEKSWLWKERALVEFSRSARTWFGTLTCAPHVHVQFLNECRAWESKQGGNFDLLSEAERVGLLHKRVTVEITKYLKRVRKEAKSRFRFLLVMETVPNHQGGLPHYHMLVHEALGRPPITKRVLAGQWRLGFEKFRLVSDPDEVRYVCKYISKDTGARVRASVGYGELRPLDIGAISTVTNCLPSDAKAETGSSIQREVL